MTAVTPKEDLMNLRLHGTHAECTAALERLSHTPGLHILDASRAYPDRGGELVRVYLTATLDPAAVPEHPPGRREDRGGGR
jgi:hypothetical protein